MAENIEIKVQVDDLAAMQQAAESLAGQKAQVLRQRDEYYNWRGARLKLRCFPDRDCELIFYRRADESGPKTSKYYRFKPGVLTPILRTLLRLFLGRKVVVEKTRLLCLVGRTRVHLDRVKGLGEFAELEVVLKPGDSHREGEQEAQRLMVSLGMREACLVQGSYSDLLLERD